MRISVAQSDKNTFLHLGFHSSMGTQDTIGDANDHQACLWMQHLVLKHNSGKKGRWKALWVSSNTQRNAGAVSQCRKNKKTTHFEVSHVIKSSICA